MASDVLLGQKLIPFLLCNRTCVCDKFVDSPAPGFAYENGKKQCGSSTNILLSTWKIGVNTIAYCHERKPNITSTYGNV